MRRRRVARGTDRVLLTVNIAMYYWTPLLLLHTAKQSKHTAAHNQNPEI